MEWTLKVSKIFNTFPNHTAFLPYEISKISSMIYQSLTRLPTKRVSLRTPSNIESRFESIDNK